MTINKTLRLFCENSKNLYFIIDTNKNSITYANPSFKSIFPDPEADEPSALLKYIHPEDRDYVIQNYQECQQGKPVTDFECRLIISAKEYYYKISPVLLVADQVRSIIGFTAEDVTLLRGYLDNLNDHNKKKNSILNIVCHDLIGPIGIIESVSRLLSKNQ